MAARLAVVTSAQALTPEIFPSIAVCTASVRPQMPVVVPGPLTAIFKERPLRSFQLVLLVKYWNSMAQPVSAVSSSSDDVRLYDIIFSDVKITTA